MPVFAQGEWERKRKVDTGEWEKKKPLILEQLPIVATIAYTVIPILEGSDFEVDMDDLTEGGIPTLQSAPDFVEEDGTLLSGTMPINEKQFFVMKIRVT